MKRNLIIYYETEEKKDQNLMEQQEWTYGILINFKKGVKKLINDNI